jgi:hypothetical protein
MSWYYKNGTGVCLYRLSKAPDIDNRAAVGSRGALQAARGRFRAQHWAGYLDRLPLAYGRSSPPVPAGVLPLSPVHQRGVRRACVPFRVCVTIIKLSPVGTAELSPGRSPGLACALEESRRDD